MGLPTLPDVPVPAEWVLNEYQQRLSDLTAGNIRLTVMVHSVVMQRNNALRRVAELEEELRGRGYEKEVIRIGSPPGVQREES